MNEQDKHLVALADEVLEVWGDQIGTHYVGCYKRHVGCFAALVKDTLEGEES